MRFVHFFVVVPFSVVPAYRNGDYMHLRKSLYRAALVLSVLFTQSIFDVAFAQDAQPIDRFEDEIRAFEEIDSKIPPAPGGTVFIGSSTFRKWKTMKKDLRDLQPINRGFGGSTIPEINHYENRLIAHLNPSRIVFYAGTNDIAEGHSPEQVLADFKTFVESAHKDAPKADIYFISMSIAPSRISMQKQFDAGNQLISEYIKTDSKLHFIDVTPVMRDSSNNLKAEFFGPDNLHMTRAGYEAWIPIIEGAVGHQH